MTGPRPTTHDQAAAADARAVLRAADPAPVAEVLGAVHRALAAVATDDPVGSGSVVVPADPDRLAVRRAAR